MFVSTATYESAIACIAHKLAFIRVLTIFDVALGLSR
jgi:hypothetical protein